MRLERTQAAGHLAVTEAAKARAESARDAARAELDMVRGEVTRATDQLSKAEAVINSMVSKDVTGNASAARDKMQFEKERDTLQRDVARHRQRVAELELTMSTALAFHYGRSNYHRCQNSCIVEEKIYVG